MLEILALHLPEEELEQFLEDVCAVGDCVVGSLLVTLQADAEVLVETLGQTGGLIRQH